MNYTYLLECSDHSFYCGWTNDLDKRVMAHNSGNGAKYTKSRRPVALVYYETYETKEAAMKRMSRREKERLIFGGPESDGGLKLGCGSESDGGLKLGCGLEPDGGQIRGRAGDSGAKENIIMENGGKRIESDV